MDMTRTQCAEILGFALCNQPFSAILRRREKIASQMLEPLKLPSIYRCRSAKERAKQKRHSTVMQRPRNIRRGVIGDRHWAQHRFSRRGINNMKKLLLGVAAAALATSNAYAQSTGAIDFEKA
ncbi:MAG: hypothetical protein ACREB5_06780, partial [Sphingomonadaceae bacterium]